MVSHRGDSNVALVKVVSHLGDVNLTLVKVVSHRGDVNLALVKVESTRFFMLWEILPLPLSVFLLVVADSSFFFAGKEVSIRYPSCYSFPTAF